jgi:hypothetical protein
LAIYSLRVPDKLLQDYKVFILKHDINPGVMAAYLREQFGIHFQELVERVKQGHTGIQSESKVNSRDSSLESSNSLIILSQMNPSHTESGEQGDSSVEKGM